MSQTTAAVVVATDKIKNTMATSKRALKRKHTTDDTVVAMTPAASVANDTISGVCDTHTDITNRYHTNSTEHENYEFYDDDDNYTADDADAGADDEDYEDDDNNDDADYNTDTSYDSCSRTSSISVNSVKPKIRRPRSRTIKSTANSAVITKNKLEKKKAKSIISKPPTVKTLKINTNAKTEAATTASTATTVATTSKRRLRVSIQKVKLPRNLKKNHFIRNILKENIEPGSKLRLSDDVNQLLESDLKDFIANIINCSVYLTIARKKRRTQVQDMHFAIDMLNV